MNIEKIIKDKTLGLHGKRERPTRFCIPAESSLPGSLIKAPDTKMSHFRYPSFSEP